MHITRSTNSGAFIPEGGDDAPTAWSCLTREDGPSPPAPKPCESKRLPNRHGGHEPPSRNSTTESTSITCKGPAILPTPPVGGRPVDQRTHGKESAAKKHIKRESFHFSSKFLFILTQRNQTHSVSWTRTPCLMACFTPRARTS